MIGSVAEIVGERSARSWKCVSQVLWESAFRVGDVMNFSWDDERKIHPVWPCRKGQHPTLAIPSSQKNKKTQEIPMLPGLQKLLERTPKQERHGWVVNTLSVDYQIRAIAEWFQPTPNDLKALSKELDTCSIAKACGVTETTVRKWLRNAGVSAETLNVVLRHKDFNTTERLYGATRAAQSAATEIHEKLAATRNEDELVGGSVGDQKRFPAFRPRRFGS